MTSKRGKKIQNFSTLYFIVSIIFLVFFLVQNGLYLYLDSSGIASDDTNRHLLNLIETSKRISSGLGLSLLWKPVSNAYPPLAYLAALPFTTAIGMNLAGIIAAQWLFWVVLAVSTFFLARRVAGGTGGFIGVMLTLGVPYLAKTGRGFSLDLPVTALVTLALLMLAESENFTRKPAAYGFFAAASLAVLTKPMAALYLSGPFLWILYQALSGICRRNPGILKTQASFHILKRPATLLVAFITANWLCPLIPCLQKHPWLCLTVSILPILLMLIIPGKPLTDDPREVTLIRGTSLFFLLIWPYYGMNFFTVLRQNTRLALAGGFGGGPARTLWLVLTTGWGVVLSIAALAGISVMARRLLKKNLLPRALPLIVAGLLWGVITVSLFPVRDYRYYLPLIPLAAVMGAYGVSSIKNQAARGVALASVLYLVISSFTWWSAPDSPFFTPFRKVLNSFPHRPHAVGWQRPQQSGFNLGTPGDTLSLIDPGGKSALVISAQGELNAYGVSHLTEVRRLLNSASVTVPLTRLGGIRPGGKQGLVYNLYMKSKNRQGRINSLIVVYLTVPGNYDLIPPGVRSDLLKGGFTHRPDLVTNLGLLRGLDGRKLELRVIRIPLKKAKTKNLTDS